MDEEDGNEEGDAAVRRKRKLAKKEVKKQKRAAQNETLTFGSCAPEVEKVVVSSAKNKKTKFECVMGASDGTECVEDEQCADQVSGHCDGNEDEKNDEVGEGKKCEPQESSSREIQLIREKHKLKKALKKLKKALRKKNERPVFTPLSSFLGEVRTVVGSDVLGIASEGDMPYVDKGRVVAEGVIHAQSCWSSGGGDSRLPVFIFVGTPGSGKTRALLETSKQISAFRGDCCCLFVTFNNHTDFYQDECKLDSDQLIIFRLLYTYRRAKKSMPWREWLSALLQKVDPVELASLRLKDVMDTLNERGQPKILLLFDDSSLPFAMGLITVEMTDCIMRSAYQLQSSKIAVLFSAFSATLINEKVMTNSQRVTLGVPLVPLV